MYLKAGHLLYSTLSELQERITLFCDGRGELYISLLLHTFRWNGMTNPPSLLETITFDGYSDKLDQVVNTSHITRNVHWT